jgi:phosphoglycerate dehydrogenase-like enzyme
MVDAAPKLRWLHVCSAGLDLPQYQPSLARGVRVTGSGGAAAVPIAQTAAAAVLAQSRGFDHWLAAQSSGRWAPLTGTARPRELHSLRALIVGTGPIGQEIARLLRAVGMHTTGVPRQATPAPGFDETLPLGRLDEALPRSDWLILALPLSPDTQGLIDARRLALLPPGARLANVARGELLDEPALVDALARGRLAGAYLDVFGVEPLPADSPLWSMPGVWITPHNSAASQGHEARVVERFVHELRRWLAAGEASAPHDNARRPT